MIKVTLLGHYGSEDLICQQAGLSTGKEPVDVPGMISRLLSWNHMKPFECAMLHFEVTSPIFVDRQLCTYRTLVGSIANSGRYGSAPIDFYIPPEVDQLDEEDREMYITLLRAADMFYTDMTEKYDGKFEGKHRAREVFRGLLPQCQLTTRRFQVNLRNLLHLLKERLGKSTQPEMRVVASQMVDLCAPLFPTVFKEFHENNQG